MSVTISNLRIVVPDGEPMYGIAVAGHQVTLSHLEIHGAPKDDVLIGGGGVLAPVAASATRVASSS